MCGDAQRKSENEALEQYANETERMHSLPNCSEGGSVSNPEVSVNFTKSQRRDPMNMRRKAVIENIVSNMFSATLRGTH